METEPLLIPYLNNPRRKPLQPPHLSTTPPLSSLFSLPENEAVITIPSFPLSIQPPQPSTPSPSLTPSSKELKDRLIFGSSSPPSTSSTLDALTLDSSVHQLDSSSTLISPSLISPSSPILWSKAKSNLHRSKTAPAITIVNDSTLHSPSHTKPKFSSNTIVRQAVLLLILYLCFGVTMYSLNRDHFTATETHPFVDALYFCIVTMCTIGYGDITPRTTWAKIYSIFFVIIGFGFVDVLLSAMVSYVLDLQENLLLTTAKGGNGKHDLAKTYIFDLKKGRMRIRMKVGLALGVVVLCIGLGTGVMHFLEHLGWVDSFYLSVMSVTTVGYGDHAFNSLYGRLFASVWLLVSTLAVARAFLYLAEARIDKRHRRLAKWVLCQDMTISEFLAADIDNNGFVSKSEYVIYKLKEMGKIAEKDILQICNQFDRLDSGNCGKITLADLMENHH